MITNKYENGHNFSLNRMKIILDYFRAFFSDHRILILFSKKNMHGYKMPSGVFSAIEMSCQVLLVEDSEENPVPSWLINAYLLLFQPLFCFRF
jgi:hypothetical protein